MKNDMAAMSIRIKRELLEKIKQLAKKDNRTLSNYVINILKRELRKEELENK